MSDSRGLRFTYIASCNSVATAAAVNVFASVEIDRVKIQNALAYFVQIIHTAVGGRGSLTPSDVYESV